MKVLMLDTVATAHGSFRQGQIYDVSPNRGKKFIDRKLARQIEEDNVKPAKRRTTSLRHGDKG